MSLKPRANELPQLYTLGSFVRLQQPASAQTSEAGGVSAPLAGLPSSSMTWGVKSFFINRIYGAPTVFPKRQRIMRPLIRALVRAMSLTIVSSDNETHIRYIVRPGPQFGGL